MEDIKWVAIYSQSKILKDTSALKHMSLISQNTSLGAGPIYRLSPKANSPRAEAMGTDLLCTDQPMPGTSPTHSRHSIIKHQHLASQISDRTKPETPESAPQGLLWADTPPLPTFIIYQDFVPTTPPHLLTPNSLHLSNSSYYLGPRSTLFFGKKTS